MSKGLRSKLVLPSELPASECSRDDGTLREMVVHEIDNMTDHDPANRSSAVKNVELSDAVMKYFENLLLSHEKRLTDRMEKSERVLIDRIAVLEKKLEEKDKVIDDLRAGRIKTDSTLAVVRAANEHLMLELDDLQQYGRRYNVRIEGIEYDDKETESGLKTKIEETLKVIGVDVKPDILDRYHRSGAPYTKNGKRYAQTIIRFRYWKPRHQAQMAKKFVRDEKIAVQIRNDLTKRRHGLRKRAIDQLPKREHLFTFADANSNLVIRDGNQLYYYNTGAELDDILSNL